MKGKSIPLGSSFTLGRAEAEPGALGGEPQLSREHARLTQTEAGGYLLDDLGSTNGTYVNAERVTGSRRLNDGDSIRVGGTTLEFVSDSDATRIVTAPAAQPAPPAQPPPRSPAATPPAPPPPPPPPVQSPYQASPTPPVEPRQNAAPMFTPGQPAQAPSAYAAGGFQPQPASGGSRTATWVAVVLGVALVVVLAGAAGYLLRGAGTPAPGPGSTPGAVSSNGPAGFVDPVSDCGANLGGGQPVAFVAYVESNRAQANGNSVILMPYRSPDLAPLPASQCPTGGSGSADLTDSGVLDADNQVIFNADRTLLFAVNQGSDTIAVFHVDPTGKLTPVAGSPFASGGMAPSSLGLTGDVLVVANKAQDGIRDLSAVAPTYTTFRIGGDGVLSQIAGSTINADAGSSPTDAYVPPGSRVAFSTEESGPMRGFSIDANGVLVQAANSPISPDAAIFGSGFNPAKEFGLGIAAHPATRVLYIGMPTVPAIAVYSYDDSGVLTFVKSIFETGGYLPCWVVTTSDGRWAYVANAGTNNITVFAVADPLTPRQIQTFAFSTAGNPWNETIDPTGKYLFVNTPRDTLGVPEGEGNTQHVLAIGADGLLTEVPGSPAKIPVATGVNPQGIAVLAINR